MRILQNSYAAYQMQPYGTSVQRNQQSFKLQETTKDKVVVAATLELSGDATQARSFDQEKLAKAVELSAGHSEKKTMEEMLDSLNDEDSENDSEVNMSIAAETYLRYASNNAWINYYQNKDEVDASKRIGSVIDVYL